jgi:hypothetical protein
MPLRSPHKVHAVPQVEGSFSGDKVLNHDLWSITESDAWVVAKMKIGALTHVVGICFWFVRKIVVNFPPVHGQIALISVQAAGYAVVSVLLQQTCATVDCSFIACTPKFVGMVSCTTLYQVHRTSSSAIGLLLRIDRQSTVRLCSLILSFEGGLPTVMCFPECYAAWAMAQPCN